MKTVLKIFVFLFVFGLVSCRDTEKESEETKAIVEQIESIENEAEKVSEEIESNANELEKSLIELDSI